MLLLMIVIVVIVIVIACKLAGVGGKAASIPLPTLQVELIPQCHIALHRRICLHRNFDAQIEVSRQT